MATCLEYVNKVYVLGKKIIIQCRDNYVFDGLDIKVLSQKQNKSIIGILLYLETVGYTTRNVKNFNKG